jgi:hypothetical protein
MFLLPLLACTSAPIDLGDADPAAVDSAAADTAPEQIGDDAGGTCDPGAPAVYAQEGDAIRFLVACTGPGNADSFTMDALPAGAVFDPTTTTFTWTPGLSDAGHYTLPVRSGGVEPDRGTVEVWVADAWADRDNVPVDPVAYEEEFGLPVFHVERPDATNEYDDVDTTVTYRGKTHAIGLKYRGASSLYYPKNSYTLSFAADDEFDDEDEGFVNRHKIVLTTTFDDNSYIRQLLCYELWSALDPARQQIQTFMAVVYINGRYEGLYLVSDHIDGEYWEDQGYLEDGSLYKSVNHAANFQDNYYGSPKSSWHDGYEKKEGVPDDFTDIDDLVKFVAEASDADFVAGIEDRVVLDEIADWWILVCYTEADDSGGKNAYLYFDATTGLVHHAPWDFNHSFGQTWQTEREASSTDENFYSVNRLFERLAADPAFHARIVDRLHVAMAGPFAADAIVARIEDHLARIEPSAERDWDKWQDQYRSYGGWSWRSDWTDHDAEVAYIEEWVTEREQYMAGWYP